MFRITEPDLPGLFQAADKKKARSSFMVSEWDLLLNEAQSCPLKESNGEHVFHPSEFNPACHCKEKYEPLWIRGRNRCDLELYTEYIKYLNKFISTVEKSPTHRLSSEKKADALKMALVNMLIIVTLCMCRRGGLDNVVPTGLAKNGSSKEQYLIAIQNSLETWWHKDLGLQLFQQEKLTQNCLPWKSINCTIKKGMKAFMDIEEVPFDVSDIRKKPNDSLDGVNLTRPKKGVKFEAHDSLDGLNLAQIYGENLEQA
ncbi:hypothetical protein Tco_1211280 [Tanacetum coccineum]